MTSSETSPKKWPIHTFRGRITFDGHTIPILVHLFMDEQFASRYSRQWGDERITRVNALDLVHVDCPDSPWEGEWHVNIVSRQNGVPYLEVKFEDRIQREETARFLRTELTPVGMVTAKNLPAFERLLALQPLSERHAVGCLKEICNSKQADFVAAFAAAGYRPDDAKLPEMLNAQQLAWLQPVYRELDLGSVVTQPLPTKPSRSRL